jgi:hypothetical protein
MLIYIPAKLLRDQEVVIKRAVSTDLPPPINTMFNEKIIILGGCLVGGLDGWWDQDS